MTESGKRSAAEAGITIEPNPNRVIMLLDADIIADSTRVASALGVPGAASVRAWPLMSR